MLIVNCFKENIPQAVDTKPEDFVSWIGGMFLRRQPTFLDVSGRPG